MFTTALAITPCPSSSSRNSAFPPPRDANGPSVAAAARLVAGVRFQTVVVTVPGSARGAKENLLAILNILPHVCLQAAGADSRALHQGGISRLEWEAGIVPSAATTTTDTAERASVRPSGGGGGGGDESGHHYHDHHRHRLVSTPHPNRDAPARHDDVDRRGPAKRPRTSPYPTVSVDEALRRIARHTPIPRPTEMAMDDPSLVGSVLAADVIAQESVPAFRASIVDGYALHVPDPHHHYPPLRMGVYRVGWVSHVGSGEAPPLEAGQVARISTGAPLPPGTNAVVMVEDTALCAATGDGHDEETIELLTDKIRPGDNVRDVGSDIDRAEILLRKGDEITAVGGEIGALASIGKTSVSVYRRPRVGVLSTGDELVPADHPNGLPLGRVRDCNRPALISALKQLGFETDDLGIAEDQWVHLPSCEPLPPKEKGLDRLYRTIFLTRGFIHRLVRIG